MAQNSTIARSHTGQHELHLTGHFQHPHWVAFLFTALAAQHISIVSGRALQDANQEWDARFELNFDRSTSTPDALDYIALTGQTSMPADTAQPQLTSYTLTPRASGLEVQLIGPDQIGFLGRILRRISLLALFPVDIQIATVAGSIKDRITFRAIGGGPVSEGVLSMLDNLLKEMVTN